MHAELLEIQEVPQRFLASGLVTIQIWEETAGEELDGVVVDELAVHVVVFDGNKDILVVIGFGELCVELQCVVRYLTHDVLRKEDRDRFEVLWPSVVAPVRCRLDVRDEDPL